jgi:hypothetical protein
LDPFLGGFGGTGWLAGQPSVRRQGLRKKKTTTGQNDKQVFQNLHNFPNSGNWDLLTTSLSRISNPFFFFLNKFFNG